MFVPRVGEEFGRYRLDRLIGQGGMGMVFAATDMRLHRTVALKVITGTLAHSAEFRDRFQHEAEALAQLDSPHVVAIHDHDEIDDTPYIVMQYVDGTDLSTRLRERGALPAKAALQISAQLARGLGAAHGRGVLHRDVKPANVLLRGLDQGDPHAYLCDFGIARSEGIDGPAPTATGMVAGTGSYLAPERADGHPATPASDLYALGCVLWVMLTGSEPYGGTEVQIALAHQSAPVPQLPGTTPLVGRLNALFSRVLAKDPADRPSDAAEVRAELEALAAEAPSTPLGLAPAPQAGTAVRGAAVPPPPPPGSPGSGAPTTPPSGAAAAPGAQPRAPKKRSRWPIAVAIVAVLAVIGGALAFVLTRGSDDGDGDETADTPPTPEETVQGDLDGDGNGDAQVYQGSFDSGAAEYVWALPSTGMRFGSSERNGGLDGRPVWGDIDGDGKGEWLWIDSITSDESLAITVQALDGQERETSIPVDPAFDTMGAATQLADVDGDGDDDMVLLGDPTDSPDLFFIATAEDGEFSDPEQWYQGGDSAGYFWTGDIDGDGAEEVVAYDGTKNKAGDESLVVLDGADGAFTASKPRVMRGEAINPYVTQWSVGDVDGDGTDELVVESGLRRGVYVYRFDGTELTDREVWSTTKRSREEARNQLYNSGIAGYSLSDVDGDDDADLVTLYEAKGKSTDLTLTVRISDGSSFAEEADWGSMSCGEQCDGIFGLIE